MDFELTPNERAYREKYKKEWKIYTAGASKGIGGWIQCRSDEFPDKTAIMFEDKSWTWDAINQESNKFAHFFYKLGLEQGDVVAVIMENCPEYLFSSAGINKIQGISSLINVNQKKRALEHALKVSDPRWIVVDGENLQNLLEIKEKLEIRNDDIFVINNPDNISHDYVNLNQTLKTVQKNNPLTTNNSNRSQICIYLFSSGTTGFPKAITLSNEKLMGVGIHGFVVLHLTPKDVLYIPTPLYHGLGFQVGWTGAVWGGAITAIRKRFSSSNYWKDIKKFGATCTVYIGEIPRYLLNLPKTEYEKNNPLKRMIGLGLRKNIWLKFKERFKVEHIYEYYGSTEVGGYINLDDVPGMVGRITSPTVVLAKFNRDKGEFYKDEFGYLIPCKPGEQGIALANLKIDTQFKGYKYKEQTEKKLLRNVFEKEDLYFNTGDLLKIHENNWVSFVDRLGNTFRWKGENVSTSEVETIINSHPSVLGSNVFGVEIPNAEGRAGMVSIKLDENLDFNLAEFSRFISKELPKYAIPIFVRIQTLPLETTGNFKLRKKNLQNEGFKVNEISDEIFVLLPGNSYYTTLTKEIFQDIEKLIYKF